ncbi:MAG: hypothetical protein UV19_C0016G0006 [Parcubacteria group bacterium GW2011_GWA2_42_28]|nr:MAG: hypothetical protein UV19_C0016G0006 [Parcubacteria group bacterium GW2011_GWA2_42_28]
MTQNNFAESMLKGRMAETLFEEMMKASGNIVYRFGYEAIVQNMTQLAEKFDRYSKVGEKIRSIPDFIVLDKKGEPLLVEVKFRYRPEAHKGDFERFNNIQKEWGATLVLVNCWEQPYFRMAKPPYFGSKRQLQLKPLTSASEWNIKEGVYREYESLVHKYLTPTLVPHKK